MLALGTCICQELNIFFNSAVTKPRSTVSCTACNHETADGWFGSLVSGERLHVVRMDLEGCWIEKKVNCRVPPPEI